ncbi:MAG: YHS domain-containing (seleno)protein [Pseudobdellovibrio sp.]
MKYTWIVLSLFYSIMAWAGPVTTSNVHDGVLIYGYDPVSYFSGKPLKGKAEIKASINGQNYLFANEENKKLFVVNPKKYQPQYEGWCATAVAKGYKYDIDPENYKVTDGKLYLFYKGWKGDAKKDWVKDEAGNIKKADQNWPEVRITEE